MCWITCAYRHDAFMQQVPAGYYTKHDYNKLYQQFFPFGDPFPFAQLMFNLFDFDRNGKLEFHEFMHALSITTRGKLDEKLKCSISRLLVLCALHSCVGTC